MKDKPPLKTLEEHDREFGKKHKLSNVPVLNGIACPECGQELKDTSPHVTLTSYPPRKTVHCESCDYRGNRLC